MQASACMHTMLDGARAAVTPGNRAAVLTGRQRAGTTVCAQRACGVHTSMLCLNLLKLLWLLHKCTVSRWRAFSRGVLDANDTEFLALGQPGRRLLLLCRGTAFMLPRHPGCSAAQALDHPFLRDDATLTSARQM